MVSRATHQLYLPGNQHQYTHLSNKCKQIPIRIVPTGRRIKNLPSKYTNCSFNLTYNNSMVHRRCHLLLSAQTSWLLHIFATMFVAGFATLMFMLPTPWPEYLVEPQHRIQPRSHQEQKTEKTGERKGIDGEGG